MKLLIRLLVGALCWSTAAFGASAVDDCTKPKTLDDIKALVTGLGYDVSTEGNLLKITVNSNYNYPVYFSISSDKAYLAIFTVLEDLPQDKVARLPAVDILQFNDAHFDYLSLNKSKGGLRFVMQNTIPPSAATPQILRTTIARLVEDSNASDMLWNPPKWN